MYLLKDEDSLALTHPFFQFGFTAAGDTAVKLVGFWPADKGEKNMSLDQLNATVAEGSSGDESDGYSTGKMVGIISGCLYGFACMFGVLFVPAHYGDK
jgi:hypothetical protein